MSDSNTAFVGSVPELYEQYLGPMYFVPSAIELARRLPRKDGAILELACGTGILTKELLSVLSPDARLTATDLNEPMIAAAKRRVTDARVQFQQADAMSLAFDEDTFDVVVCQYGVMFFPDKVLAAAQVRRVLRHDGTYLFNVWGTLSENPFAAVAQRVITECYPNNTPTFYCVPWGYADRHQIADDLRAGGFLDVQIEVVDMRCRAASAEHVAMGLVQGSPMVMAIHERATHSVEVVTHRMAEAIAREFDSGPIETTMRALFVSAR